MPAYLAMSCLQGRTQESAWRELCALGPDGIQLTPGNLPSEGFARMLATTTMPVRAHHGFVVDELRTKVWGADGRLLVPADGRSVHPPMDRDGIDASAWLESAVDRGVVVEVMYPGYPCGDREVESLLEAGVDLAVDVSHLKLQRAAGVLSARVEQRLLDSDRVVEVHVSDNDGVKDSHTALTPAAYGLGYARARARSSGAAGVVVVLESYFHKASDGDRRRQLDLLR